MLEAAERYAEKQARGHGRLIRALQPDGDRSTSFGEAVRRAAQDLGIERNGQSFEEFAGLVVAAAEASSSWCSITPPPGLAAPRTMVRL